jgi:uncharacterized hydrophobic protein (TIGR00271 family)
VSGETRAVLQIRVICPPDLTPRVLEELRAEHGTASVATHPRSALAPEGDLIVVEVARERGNAVVDTHVALDVPRRGAISIIALEAHTSRQGDEAQRLAAGHGVDALLWEELEERAADDARASVTFVALMALAALIATIALILDSPVLVIGAMILGPEYAPLTALAVSIYRRRPGIRIAATTLVGGLVVAIAASALLTAALRAIGEIDSGFTSGDNFFTKFVSDPNVYSFLVAFIAGIAGTIALAQGRQAVLAGVLVSVTTIPAAAAVGLDAVTGDWSGAGKALAQLTVNLVALLLASLATLWVHDRAWRRVTVPPPRRPRR